MALTGVDSEWAIENRNIQNEQLTWRHVGRRTWSQRSGPTTRLRMTSSGCKEAASKQQRSREMRRW